MRQVNPLIQLAMQFGQARGEKQACGPRSARRPIPTTSTRTSTIRTSAARSWSPPSFDAFFSVYMSRADDLFRIYRATGRAHASESPTCPGRWPSSWPATPAETAVLFFQLCARALDYCPPVDLTFGDFLRAAHHRFEGPRPRDDQSACATR